MNITIKDLMPRNTVGVIPVSEDYLNEFAKKIIEECAWVAEQAKQSGDVSGRITEHFALR